MFRKILIANRGEVAVRIIRSCQELGIRTVAVYSDADANALHTMLADESVPVGPAPPSQSYLCGDCILEQALRLGCDALHPGYGFLSENADFAQSVIDAGLTWIGPDPAAMRTMGSKTSARAAMLAAGVPVVPGRALVYGRAGSCGEVRDVGKDAPRVFRGVDGVARFRDGRARGRACLPCRLNECRKS